MNKDPRWIDLTGHQYGSWHVLRFLDGRAWLCRCECGMERRILAPALRNGMSTKCRTCSNRQGKFGRTHGMYGTPVYRTWGAIMNRCNSPTNPRYADYGGRGIRVCQRWHSFENFYADVGDRPVNRSIDRWPDKNGDYCPDNFRWATVDEQNNNKRAYKRKSLPIGASP